MVRRSPIQATIVGIAPPAYSSAWDGSDSEAPPTPWNGSSLQVDELGVMSGIDLHSKIAGENSGVFVSIEKRQHEIPESKSAFAGHRSPWHERDERWILVTEFAQFEIAKLRASYFAPCHPGDKGRGEACFSLRVKTVAGADLMPFRSTG